MRVAYDASNKRITIALAENGFFREPIRCEFCDALVSFVNGFMREVGNETVTISPFFRLKKDQKHHDDCFYNVRGQIKIIARESKGDIFVALEDERFELRLLAVKKTVEALREHINIKQHTGTKSSQTTTEKKYVLAKKRLGSYINSAQRVLRVRAFCEKHSDIEDVLRLKFDGVFLPWRDFYYEDRDYFRCFQFVCKATVQVPIAIKGIVKSNQVVKGRSGIFAVINLVGPFRQTDQEDVLDAANFSIWSPDLDSFKFYKKGDEVLAFGMWSSLGIKENRCRNPKSTVHLFRNHELCLWPVLKTQLCKIST